MIRYDDEVDDELEAEPEPDEPEPDEPDELSPEPDEPVEPLPEPDDPEPDGPESVLVELAGLLAEVDFDPASRLSVR